MTTGWPFSTPLRPEYLGCRPRTPARHGAPLPLSHPSSQPRAGGEGWRGRSHSTRAEGWIFHRASDQDECGVWREGPVGTRRSPPAPNRRVSPDRVPSLASPDCFPLWQGAFLPLQVSSGPQAWAVHILGARPVGN